MKPGSVVNHGRAALLAVILPMALLLSGCVGMTMVRMPSSIPKETNNIQWYLRVTPGVEGPAGMAFRFVVWLHVPEDWQLAWGKAYSFSGDFDNGSLTKEFGPVISYVTNPGQCPPGGMALTGYKWQAWTSEIQVLPPDGQRVGNEVALRGGLRIPASGLSGVFEHVRIVVGSQYDSDDDSVPDSYVCSGTAESRISVP